MKIKYQGKETETDATTVAAFLVERDVKPTRTIVEVDGEIVSADAVGAMPLREGAEVNAFRVVAGG